MNRKLIRTLSLVCLTLLVVILCEWLYADYAQEKLLSPSNAPAKQSAPEEMPTIDLSAQTEDSYADLVNRPLFISGRKPVEEAPKDEIQGQASIAAGNVTFDWLLSGVYTTKKGLTALLSRSVAKAVMPVPNAKTAKTANGNYRKVVAGDNIDGWNVSEIHPVEILLTQGGAQKKLPLRKPKAKDASSEPEDAPPVNPRSIRGRVPNIPNVPNPLPPPEEPQ
jgi:hypothetical protein